MPLPKLKRGLYAYPAEGWGGDLPPQGQAQKDGGTFFAFDDKNAQEDWRTRLLEAKLLCSFRPVPVKWREPWSAFLSGAGPLKFRPFPFVFGPLWYLSNGLETKLFLLLVPLAAAASLLNAAGVPTGGLIGLTATVGSASFPLGVDMGAWVAFSLYAGVFGAHDLYRRSIHRETIWSSLASPAARIASFALAAACAAVWAGTAVSMNKTLGYDAGGGLKVSISMSEPLWRYALESSNLDAAAARVVADPSSQELIAEQLIVLSRSLTKRGDDAGARRAAEASVAYLTKASRAGNPKAAAILSRLGPPSP